MLDPKLARAYGTLAGFGFVGVAVLTLPSTRLLDPMPAPEAYLLTLVGLVTGLICLAVPWDWFDPRWLNLVGVAAIIEAAATVEVFGQPYVALFFLIAVLAAYVSPDRRTMGLHLGLTCVALFAPVFYGPENARSSLHVALVVTPVLLLITALFAYLRLKMVHDRRAYHRFAEQTLVLSSQIAGRQVGPVRLPPQSEPVPRLSHVRLPVPALAAVAAVLGIPLFAGGLAAAGVKLPDVAYDPFERVGIELPNQEEPGAESPRIPAPQVKSARPAEARGRAGGTDDETAPKAGRNDGDGAPLETSEGTASTAIAPATDAPAPDRSDPGPAPQHPESPAGSPAVKPTPIQDLLDEAKQGLQGLLDQIRGAAGGG